FNCFPY
ncbi:hypothetical protein CARUB_v100039481mg, partial [Capsella rubella]